MARPRHPKAEVEKAVQYAERLGWRVVMSSGHAWGRMLCPHANRNGCMVSVWSTPKNEGNHARQLRRVVDRCHHPEGDQQE